MSLENLVLCLPPFLRPELSWAPHLPLFLRRSVSTYLRLKPIVIQITICTTSCPFRISAQPRSCLVFTVEDNFKLKNAYNVFLYILYFKINQIFFQINNIYQSIFKKKHVVINNKWVFFFIYNLFANSSLEHTYQIRSGN